MKNLVKNLEWIQSSNEDLDEPKFIAATSIPKTSYVVYGDCESWTAYMLHDLSLSEECQYIFGDTAFVSQNEAKAACQEHFAEIILAGLSPEAVAALESISSPNQTFNT
jgi:hypothetical protein